MRLSRNLTAAVVALVLLIVFPGLAAAASKGKAKAAKEYFKDERAIQIFERACASLAGLKGFSFLASVTLDKVYEDGSKIQVGRRMDVSVLRPGSFKVVTDGDDFQAVAVFDGKTFGLSLPDRKVHGQLDAALDIDGLMDLLASRYGIESPLGDLIANTPCDKTDILAAYYVGKARIGNTVCDHLFFQGKEVDWQIWVEDSPASLPRKLVITERRLPMAPQFSAVLGAWKTAPPDPETFVFSAPAGSTRDDGVILGVKPAGKQ